MSIVRSMRHAALCALLSAALVAQGCPQGNVVLAVAPSSAGMISVSVTGTPGAAATLFIGPNAGQTTLMGGPLAGTVICLGAPFNAQQLGPIPPAGTKTMQMPAPPMPPGGTLRFQAVTAAMNGPGTPPVVDTSNVITLGGGPPPPPPPCTPGAVQLGVAPASVPPGAPVTVTVTGTPGAGVILFFSPALGSTLLPGPGPAMGTVICLGQPMHAAIGQIPPSGTRTIQFPTPPGAPIGSSLHYQAVTTAPAQPAPVVDTSNVATVTFTAPPPPPPCVPGAAILTITPDVPVQPGNTISVSVTATAGSLVVIARSHALGSTSFPFLTNPLCLAMPIDADFFGVIPAGGTLTQTHTVPPNAILPGNVTIEFQAVVVSASGSVLGFDTSNTDFLML